MSLGPSLRGISDIDCNNPDLTAPKVFWKGFLIQIYLFKFFNHGKIIKPNPIIIASYAFLQLVVYGKASKNCLLMTKKIFLGGKTENLHNSLVK